MDLQSLTLSQWGMIAAAIAAILGINFLDMKAISAWWNKPKNDAMPSVPAVVDEDALDLAAYRRLQARFERLKCKEGQAAMVTAGQHFLHTEGH